MINYKVSKYKSPKGVEGTDYFSCKAAKTSDYHLSDQKKSIRTAIYNTIVMKHHMTVFRLGSFTNLLKYAKYLSFLHMK